MSDENDLQEPFIERLSASPEPTSAPTSHKRKRGAVEQSAGKATKKSKKSKKSKAAEEDGLDVKNGINTAFSHMDNQLLADYVAQRTRKHQSELSTIELEDTYIPGKLGLSTSRIV